MYSDNFVRDKICIGYTFVFRGVHCTITRLLPWGFRYKTYENDRCWMQYSFFQTTNHFKSIMNCRIKLQHNSQKRQANGAVKIL